MRAPYLSSGYSSVLVLGCYHRMRGVACEKVRVQRQEKLLRRRDAQYGVF